MPNLLCKIGLHDWTPLDFDLDVTPVYKITLVRGCKKCHRKEIVIESFKGVKKKFTRDITLADLRQMKLDDLLG